MNKILSHILDISSTVAILHGAYTIHPGIGWIALGIVCAAMAHDLKKHF